MPGIHNANDMRRLGLEELRVSRGIRLEDVAAKTKISIRFLRAIEAEDFASLPGGVYNVSYIRQYASEIGYDESGLLQWHNAKLGLDQPDRMPPARAETRVRALWNSLFAAGNI